MSIPFSSPPSTTDAPQGAARPTPSAATDAAAAPDRPRRVLLLVDAYHGPYGGTEGQIHTLVSHLPPTWTAELWALRPTAWLENGTFPCSTRVLDVRSLRSPRTIVRLGAFARQARRAGFDLVHTFMNDASALGAFIARRAGLPLLIARRDLGFWQTPRWLDLLRHTDRFASGVLANCEAVRAHTAAAEHVPPGMIHVVHNGQPPARFEAARDPDLRARLDVPADAPVVGFLANVKALKRQDDLLGALARLRGAHPDLHVWFIGDDYSPEVRLTDRAAAQGLADRVRVFRVEGEAAPALKHLTAGVLCSETEGLSNAVIEYLGCGLPVVATRVGGNPDLVVDGENGFLYEPGDVDALAAHLDVVLRDPAKAQGLGAASRTRYEAHFTVDRMVRDTIACYLDALEDDEDASAGPTLRWDVVEDLDTLETLAPTWESHLTADQFFLSPDWVLTALHHAPDPGRPHVLVARDVTDALVGLLPLARRAGGVLEIAGQRFGGDHLDVVAARGHEHDVAAGALAHLRTLRWRRLHLRHLAEDGALRLAIRQRRWRLPFREHLATVCPYLPVEGTYEAYVAAQSSGVRRNLRRYPKRFLGLPGAAVERVRAVDEVATGVDRVLDLHARRFAHRGERTTMAPALRTFHRRLAERAARAGRVALTFLRLGERDVAGEYGFLWGGKVYAFQGGHDPDTEVVSPGLVLRAQILEHEVFGAGLHEYDFLDGAEPYKRAWASRTRRLFDLEVHPEGLRGRLRCLLRGAPRLLRDALRGGRRSGPEASPGEPS